MNIFKLKNYVEIEFSPTTFKIINKRSFENQLNIDKLRENTLLNNNFSNEL